MKLSIPTPNPVVHLQASESVDVSGQFPDMGTLVAERTARQTNRRDSAADWQEDEEAKGRWRS